MLLQFNLLQSYRCHQLLSTTFNCNCLETAVSPACGSWPLGFGPDGGQSWAPPGEYPSTWAPSPSVRSSAGGRFPPRLRCIRTACKWDYTQGGGGGSPRWLYQTHSQSLEWQTHICRKQGSWSSEESWSKWKKSAQASTTWRWTGNWGIWDSESFPFTILHYVFSLRTCSTYGSQSTVLAQLVQKLFQFQDRETYMQDIQELCGSSPVIMKPIRALTKQLHRCNTKHN